MPGLSTSQVARRLGVKPETVYAYVSRGLLHSTRSAAGRGSEFDPAEVERFAARAGRRAAGPGGPRVRTALTRIESGRLTYRGWDAVTLADTHPFEAVATLLWTGQLPTSAPAFTAPPGLVAPARAASTALPATARLTDRLRVATATIAAVDELRWQFAPEAVAATGAGLLAALVDSLPLRGSPAPAPGLAARLWPRLTARPATAGAVELLDAALVLLADHDLAASTVAARAAASARAHPYAVVGAGLAAFDGPLHGAAPSRAYRLLAEAIESGDPFGVYADRLRAGEPVVGFAPHIHHGYPAGDVRAAALLRRLAELPVAPELRAAVDGLVAAAGQRAPHPPNSDFALAALAYAGAMVPDAGEAIFAIARTAGWIAHALEEYREPGLRFRLAGSYAAVRATPST